MDSQIVSIVKFLIRETPVGHLKSLLDSVKIIVGQDVIESPEIQSEITKFEEDHFKQVQIDNDKILLSQYNKSEDNFYIDQNKGLKVKTIPLNDNFEKIENIEKEGDELREQLYEAYSAYKNKNYKDENTSFNGKI